MKISIKGHGTAYDYDYSSEVSSVWKDISHEFQNNPFTGTSWTWEEVDDLEAGISLEGGSFISRCTQLFVEVDYDTKAFLFSIKQRN